MNGSGQRISVLAYLVPGETETGRCRREVLFATFLKQRAFVLDLSAPSIIQSLKTVKLQVISKMRMNVYTCILVFFKYMVALMLHLE